MLRHGLHALRIGIIRVAIISSASEFWTLFSDDLSSVIFGQSTVAAQIQEGEGEGE